MRYRVIKDNKSEVATNSFLAEDFSDVSALIGSSTYHTIDREPTLTLVHNPHANRPIPMGFAKPVDEIYALCELDGTYTINRMRNQ